MAELNVNGRMLVKNLKKQFQEVFGCSLSFQGVEYEVTKNRANKFKKYKT